MMIHPSFPKDELEREKGVVIQELKMYEDNPIALVMQKWQNYYFGDNSYGWPTIWTEENIRSFTQADLFAHQADLYAKDNLIIVIAGKIADEAAVRKQLEETFGTLPDQKRISKPPFVQKLPTDKIAFYDKKTEQNHLVISAPGFDGNDEQRYAANVLATILGGNMSSRLFQNIREKQWLCYYIQARHTSNEDTGIFIIRAGIDKERFDFGLEKIFEEIARVANGDITQEEFDNAIWYNEGQIQMGIESSDEMASFLGGQFLIYNKVETLEDILKKYKALKLADIQAIASKLKRENCFLYYIK
jgi:predicted Zn-dependent peptidase